MVHGESRHFDGGHRLLMQNYCVLSKHKTLFASRAGAVALTPVLYLKTAVCVWHDMSVLHDVMFIAHEHTRLVLP